MMITMTIGSTPRLCRFAGGTPRGPISDPKVMCEPRGSGYPKIRTGLPQSVPRLQARRRARFAGSFVCSLRFQHREPSTVRPAAARGSSFVEVPADDLALLDLFEDLLPRVVRELLADTEVLVGQVVELEDDRIRLPAIDARMGGEVLD